MHCGVLYWNTKVKCTSIFLNIHTVVIGFNQVDYTIDENTGTVLLSVSIRYGNIPEAETRIITLTTSDGTAQCMLVIVTIIDASLLYKCIIL